MRDSGMANHPRQGRYVGFSETALARLESVPYLGVAGIFNRPSCTRFSSVHVTRKYPPLMMPDFPSTRRMAWLKVSQRYRAPSGPRTTPNGPLIRGLEAGPPSPVYPGSPVPAKVSMVAARLGKAKITVRSNMNRAFTEHPTGSPPKKLSL
jgi:hypothetical protein